MNNANLAQKHSLVDIFEWQTFFLDFRSIHIRMYLFWYWIYLHTIFVISSSNYKCSTHFFKYIPRNTDAQTHTFFIAYSFIDRFQWHTNLIQCINLFSIVCLSFNKNIFSSWQMLSVQNRHTHRRKGKKQNTIKCNLHFSFPCICYGNLIFTLMQFISLFPSTIQTKRKAKKKLRKCEFH